MVDLGPWLFIIGGMKMRNTAVMAWWLGWGSLLAGASGAWAQVENLNPQAPKIEGGNATLIAWAVAGAFSLGILAIAFRNAKRGHME